MAELERRSVSQVIVLALEDKYADRQLVRDDTAGADKPNRKRTSLPVLQSESSDKVDVHPVQQVRSELGERSGRIAGPENHVGHQTYIAGDRHWCSTCKEYY